MQKRRGFTTVELVIVIAVIAILATALIPTFGGLIKSAYHTNDVQHATNLSTLLMMYNMQNGIKDEYDLAAAINAEMGEGYYESLEPKSAKYGYDFWFDFRDPQNPRVLVATLEEIAEMAAQMAVLPPVWNVSDMDITLSAEQRATTQFDGGLRGSLFNGFFLMGAQGDSDLISIITGLENLTGPQDYEDVLAELAALDESSNDTIYAGAVDALVAKVANTVILNEKGAFRYTSAPNATVYIPMSTTKLENTQLFLYDGTTVASGVTPSAATPITTQATIKLPAGVVVNRGGLPAASFNNTDPLYLGTTEIAVFANSVDTLKDIFAAGATDCVIILSGERYIIDGDKVFKLPLTGTPVVYLTYNNAVNQFDFFCNDASESTNTGSAYLERLADGSDVLYVAYNKKSYTLSVGNFNTDAVDTSIIWSVEGKNGETVPHSITSDGVLTIGTLEGAIDNNINFYVVATAVYGGHTEKLEVCVDIMSSVSGVLGGTISLDNNAGNNTHTIDYTGTTEFTFAVSSYSSTYQGYVVLDKTVTLTAASMQSPIFTANGNTMTLKKYKGAQSLTVNVGGHITETFDVTVVNKTESPIQKNYITSDVQMGKSYLFRVGNKNTVSLSSLFSAEDNNVTSDVVVTIYDASKTEQDGTRTEIASAPVLNVETFYATYTANSSDWRNGTIQFNGTGVAIINIKTDAGEDELAVEVVPGYNITTANQLKGSENNILLNDITLGSGGSFSLSSGKSLWGNGFTFNVEAGSNSVQGIIQLNSATIDNVRVVGKVYETLSGSNNTAYNACTVIALGDSTISNCYISNCRAPLRSNGTIKLINTTLDGGRFANVEHRMGTLIIDNVTTIGMPRDGVLGLGIVVYHEASAGTSIVINGPLKQYNFIKEDDQSSLPSAAKVFMNQIFSDKSLASIRFTTADGTVYANTGILFLNGSNSDLTGMPDNYVCCSAEYSGSTAYVYAPSNSDTSNSVDLTAPNWVPSKQGVFAPTFVYSDPKSDEDTDNEYSYMEDGTIKMGDVDGAISLDIWEYIKMSKYTGQTWVGNFSAVGGAPASGSSTGDNKVTSVTFNADGSITYTYIDTLFFNPDGTMDMSKTVEYSYTYAVDVTKTTLPASQISISSPGAGIWGYWKSSILSDADYYICVPILSGLQIDKVDENGTVIENIYNNSSNTTAWPEGLSVSATLSTGGKNDGMDAFRVYNNTVYFCSHTAINNKDDVTKVTVTYYYAGTDSVKGSEFTITFSLNTSSTTVGSITKYWTKHSSEYSYGVIKE